MKPIKYVTIFIAIASGALQASGAPTKKLLLLDTAQGEAYQYKPMLEMAKNVGFEVEYIPLAKIMDSTNLSERKFDAVFFLFSIEFLKQMDAPVSKKILSILDAYAKQQKKLIGLIFPPGIVQGIGPFNPIFEKVGLKFSENSLDIVGKPAGEIDKQSLINFIKATNRFLSLPVAARGIDYDTMIFRPQPAAKSAPLNIQSTTKLALLPIRSDFRNETKKLFPYGIYWKNAIKNNHLFISNQSIIGYSTIDEDFRVIPADFELRMDTLNAIQEMLWELSVSVGLNPGKQRPALPKSVAAIGKGSKGNLKIKSPWMIIEEFYKDDNHEKQAKLIEHILHSNLTHLWLSIAPNWYYSPIAARNNKQGPMGPSGVKKSVNNFTKKLVTKAAELNKPLPKILIGFEIANNLQGKVYQNKAYDLYGNSYPDVPAPLNKEFWNNEITISLTRFLNDWKKASNGVPVNGIVIDLEMYVKSSGTFLSSMGFDTTTFNNFRGTSAAQPYEITSSLLDRNSSLISFSKTNPSAYLMRTKLSQKYFDYLYQGAEALGAKLKSEFESLIPNCIIGCYAPNISASWFYKGFYKGLSSQSKPLMLFTFNAEYETHKPWLKKNSININHCGALMLSKIQQRNSNVWVDDLLKHHDGLWLNRFSTLTEPYLDHPEHTPVSRNPRALREFLSHIATR